MMCKCDNIGTRLRLGKYYCDACAQYVCPKCGAFNLGGFAFGCINSTCPTHTQSAITKLKGIKCK